MANFANIANVIEGIINNQLSATRTNQGTWEWYNALQRIMSANRFTGTPRVDGPVAVTGTDRDVEAGAVRLFGILVDNAMAAEDGYVAIYNTNTVTEGSTNAVAYLWAPRAAITCYVFPNGITLDTAFTVSDILGTEAGLEAGTATTSGLTILSVYTE